MILGSQREGAASQCLLPPLSPLMGDSSQAAAVEAIGRHLLKSHYREVRRIDCKHRGGAIVLEGRVSSYFQKQMALATAKLAVPTVTVHDEVRVEVDR